MDFCYLGREDWDPLHGNTATQYIQGLYGQESTPRIRKMIYIIKQNRLLLALIALVTLGVLVFNIFHYSTSYGITEINNVNSLFLVPFILLVCWLGYMLGSTKNLDAIERAYHNQLTQREKQVLKLIAMGKKNQHIADELYVDISTIKSHINTIYKKTGLKNRKELRFYLQKAMEKDVIP